MKPIRLVVGFAFTFGLASGTFSVAQLTSSPQPTVALVLVDGSQISGTVLSQSTNQLAISSNSFQALGAPPVLVKVDLANIASCSMVEMVASSITVAGHLCASTAPTIHSGFQQLSLSLGYIGSAQRDESAKGTATIAGYQSLNAMGAFRGKTSLYLSASYDDKWKATPLSSNITQNYLGLFTQSIFTRRTPASKCSSDDYPTAYQLIGYSYHNNSQGIDVDQSYGLGVSRQFALGKSLLPKDPNCSRAVNPYSQRIQLSVDVRSVNYTLYPPGRAVQGIGSQVQFGYSRTVPSKQSIGLTIGGVPVYNNAKMSQASGNFEYAVPIKSSWALLFSVTDNYYEIAPKTFNKNYINLSLGLKFAPLKTGTTK